MTNFILGFLAGAFVVGCVVVYVAIVTWEDEE